MIAGSDRYSHCFTMYDKEALVEFTDILEINTLELCKIPERSDGTEMYDWIRFIAADTEEELDMAADSNPVIKKAVVTLRELSADERARDMFERRERALRDERMRIRGALQQGIQQGIQQVAARMLNEGMNNEEIIRITGLSLEQIDTLRKDSKENDP